MAACACRYPELESLVVINQRTTPDNYLVAVNDYGHLPLVSKICKM